MKRILGAVLLAVVATGLAYGLIATRRERAYHDFVRRGDAALARDDTYEAIEAFGVAISWKSDAMAAHLKRGEAYRRRNELEFALNDLRRAAEIDPGSPLARELLGDVQYAMAAREKDFAPARFARAVEHYQESLALDDTSVRVQYKLGLAAYRLGQFPSALKALRSAIQLDARFVEAHYLLGVCLREAGRPRESVRALEGAVALNPAFLAAREELAETYRVLGRQDDRLTELAALAALQPSSARDRALGIAYATAGQVDRGLSHLGRTAQRYPADGDIFFALGRLWLDRASAGTVELNKALQALPAAVDANSSSEAMTAYGRALMLDGQTARAEAMLRQATTRFPVEPLAFLYLSEASHRLANPDAARQALIDYSALVLLDDLSPSLLVRIADAHLTAGNTGDARRAVHAALDKDPRHARALALQERIDG